MGRKNQVSFNINFYLDRAKRLWSPVFELLDSKGKVFSYEEAGLAICFSIFYSPKLPYERHQLKVHSNVDNRGNVDDTHKRNSLKRKQALKNIKAANTGIMYKINRLNKTRDKPHINCGIEKTETNIDEMKLLKTSYKRGKQKQKRIYSLINQLKQPVWERKDIPLSKEQNSEIKQKQYHTKTVASKQETNYNKNVEI